MSDRRTETISLGKGVHYAKVASRSAEFHRDHEKCSIETTCEFKEGFVLFVAKVTTKKGTFTGHSMDKLGARQKQFEKQETIAVGRALAFAGYLASGEIACAEEMDDIITEMQLNTLKSKYLTVFHRTAPGLSHADKQSRFNEWCRQVIQEDVDYCDRAAWCSEWYQAALDALSVPFGEES